LSAQVDFPGNHKRAVLYFDDTNVISELMRAAPEPTVVQWVGRLPFMDLFVWAVTKAEIEVGVGLLPDGKRKEKLAAAAKAMFGDPCQRCLAFDDADASTYARLVEERQRSGRPVIALRPLESRLSLWFTV